MKALFQTVIFQPLFNLFVWLSNVTPGHDMGVVIILVTILVRLALWPLSGKSLDAQKKLADLQPQISELKVVHKDDKQALAAATMKLYKDNNINPFSSCLPLLIQLPILLGLYWALSDALSGTHFNFLYSGVNNPGSLNPMAFGFLNLMTPSIILAALAGLAQFFQARMLTTKRPPVHTAGSKDEELAAAMNKQMMYIMPLLTIFIGSQLMAGITLYWLVTTLLTILQQHLVFKKHDAANAAAKTAA